MEIQLTKTRQRQPKGSDALYIGIILNTEMEGVEKSVEVLDYATLTEDEKALIDSTIQLISAKVKPVVKQSEITQ